MHVLCADADPEDRSATASALESAAFDVTVTGSVGAARDALQEGTPDAVVSEYELPDGTGLELFATVRERVPDATCVLFTSADFAAIDTGEYGDIVVEYLSKEEPDALTELTALLGFESDPVMQAAYPLPDDEAGRVEALERYVEHPEGASESIDRLTELAAAMFDVDSAAVGLIDAHHERFLSCHGAAFDTLDREASVCTYAILDTDVTVVEDVGADPRFADNEGLAAAGIAFYAGAPLVTESGHAIGTFCIQADEPRTFGEDQRRHLTLFAEAAMEQIELRHRLWEDDG
jgi:CheY-like chemotaxis protein